MKYEKNQPTFKGDNSSLQLKDLNETQLSHLTKGSGENDFKEYTIVINL